MLNLCLARSVVSVRSKIGMRIPWEIYPLMLCERLCLCEPFFLFFLLVFRVSGVLDRGFGIVNTTIDICRTPGPQVYQYLYHMFDRIK
jgi:hypothetical protein